LPQSRLHKPRTICVYIWRSKFLREKAKTDFPLSLTFQGVTRGTGVARLLGDEVSMVPAVAFSGGGHPPADSLSDWIGNKELTAPSDTRVLSQPFGGGGWGDKAKPERLGRAIKYRELFTRL